jgi:hypothetical protein
VDAQGVIARRLALLLAIAAVDARADDVALRIDPEAPHAVVVAIGSRDVAATPAEGLWSVALGIEHEWPSQWRHVRPRAARVVGDWTILDGELVLDHGTLRFTDSWRRDGGFVRATRRFAWDGDTPLTPCVLSVRVTALGAASTKPYLPGISAWGNPSGATHGGRVAIQTGAAGEDSYYEEHRYPMPFADLAWDGVHAALHTRPSALIGGARADLWWSLGTTSGERDAELGLLSGPCASNGRHGVVKALQGEFMPYPSAWITLAPGAVVEKEFVLDVGACADANASLARGIATALTLHEPYALDGLPSYAEIVRAKIAYANSRWREHADTPGFEMYPDFVEGTHYVMGWCGQAEALGFAARPLEARFGSREFTERATRALDVLARAPFREDGFLQRYSVESNAWSELDFVSQGQALESFTRAIEVARERGDDTASWDAFVLRACELHAERILRDAWRPGSTNEAFFVAPLLRASRLFERPRFAAAATKAGEHYALRHAGIDEPYWGGTLDASCEDKEGAWAAFQAFLALFDHTHDARWLARAEHAMNATLAYTMVWDVDLPAGRLRDHGFRSRGWTVVSAQNQHLDVFGVFYTPEIWRMGELLGRPELKRLAAVMFRSCGQLIDALGSQGEQIQHTNFAQAGDMSDVARLRGGYSEGWTVFWITTHFLHAAARFEQMGVDLDEEPMRALPR